jgi:heat shock protein HslJ
VNHSTTEGLMAHSQIMFSARYLGLLVLISSLVVACNRNAEPATSESLATSEKSHEAQASDQPKPVLKTDPMIARKVMKGEWRLVAIDERQLRQGGTPTVVFGDEGNCWGNTGVNDFHTTFTLGGPNDDRVKVGPAAVTRKAGPPEAMALETLFLERFESASAYKVVGDVLHLHAGDNQNLTFERVVP